MMRHFVLLALILSGVAFAEDDGNKLLERCRDVQVVLDGGRVGLDGKPTDAGFCMGYIGGVKDGLWSAQIMAEKQGASGTGVCLPRLSIEHGQAVRVVLKWLKDHPNRLHENSVVLTLSAFQEAFPCSKS